MTEDNSLLQKALQNTPVVFWAVDKNGMLTLYEGERVIGFEAAAEAVGQSYQHVFEETPELIAAMEEALNGSPASLVIDHGAGVVEARLSPEKDKKGQVIGVAGFAFDITERRHAEVELRAQKQLFENLVAIARATTERPTLEATLQNALNVAAEMTGAELGSLFLLNEDGEVLQSLVARGRAEPKGKRELVNRVMTGGLAGWVVRNRRSVLIDDTDKDDRWNERPGNKFKARSSLSVPILIGDLVIGVMTLTHPDPERFTEDHLNLIQAAGDQMALALRNAQMYEEQRKLAEFQLTLYEVLRNVGSYLDPESVARVAVEEIFRLTKWPWVAIAIPDLMEQRLVIHAQAGDFSIGEGWSVQFGEGGMGEAFETGETKYLPDVSQLPVDARLHPSIDSELAIPLRRGRQVMGVLDIESDDLAAFSTSDIQLAESLADAISLTLENARLFQESQSTAERLRELDRLKSSFLANMSHELRTPLNAILGYSELLQEDAKDFGIEDFVLDLEKIQRAGKHLLAVINDILDFSKIEAGRMDLFLESFDVTSLIDDVVTTIQPVIEKSENSFELDVDPELGSMSADPTKVRQIIINLLSNAAKFSEKGSIALKAWRLENDDLDWVRFVVEDSGIGMSTKQLENLFQPFIQGDISTTRKYGGTGLGLAITRGFCQMMGGHIEVESELGKGSRFTVDIPAEVTDYSTQIL